MIGAARALVLVLGLAVASAASAAPPPSDADSARATSLYEQGYRMLQAGDPKASLGPLEASMALLPSPNTELLLGHALRQLGDKALALEKYVHVRSNAKARIAAGEGRFSPTLKDAEHWIAELTPEVAELSVNVTNAPEGAALFINGREASWLPGSSGTVRAGRMHVEPGVAKIEVRVAGRTIATSESKLGRGVTGLVTIDAGGTAPPSKATVQEQKGGIRPPPIAAWVAGGIGAGGMIAFAAAGGVALSKASELDACAPHCDPSDPAAVDARETGKTAALVANVSVAIGAAGLVTGAALWIFWPREKAPTSSVSLDVGLGSFGVRTRF